MATLSILNDDGSVLEHVLTNEDINRLMNENLNEQPHEIGGVQLEFDFMKATLREARSESPDAPLVLLAGVLKEAITMLLEDL